MDYGMPANEYHAYAEAQEKIQREKSDSNNIITTEDWINKLKGQPLHMKPAQHQEPTITRLDPTITDLKTQEALFIDFTEKMRSIIFKKGNDYSEGGLDESSDRLSNFKLAGSICGLSAEQNCLSLIATKISRIGVLLKKSTADNESLEDSLLDGANYFFLLYCLRMEKSK